MDITQSFAAVLCPENDHLVVIVIAIHIFRDARDRQVLTPQESR